MQIDPIYLFYGIVFIAAALLVEGAFYLYVDARGGKRMANRRQRMIAAGADVEKILVTLRRPTPTRLAAFGLLGEVLMKLDRLIAQTGSTTPLKRIVATMLGLTVTSFLALNFYIGSSGTIPYGPATVLAITVLSLAIGFGSPIAHLLRLKARRIKRFEEQLPDALDTMVRGLRAGLAINIAMGLTAKQMPDPIGTEFGLALDEMTYGRDLQTAVARIGDRVPLQDFQFVSMAIAIQHNTGGNLAEVLSNLSTLIRSRFRMHKRVRALSAEGRFSAKVLAILPFAFFAVTFSAQPKYYLAVAHDSLFIQILAGGFILQLIGMLIMHRLINFKV